MAPRIVRSVPALLVLLLALTPAAGAQSRDADVVLEDLATAVDELRDAAFRLTGFVVDPDGNELALEMEVELIPGETAAGAYIVQPDALADNMVVLDGDALYNYTFLTNQVTVFDADDPDAVGDLLGGVADPEATEDAAESFEPTFDVRRLFEAYDASWVEAVESPHGTADVVSMVPHDDAAIAEVLVTVPRETSLPYTLAFLRGDGSTLASLTLEDLRVDSGLARSDVTYLPEDAEVIDERRAEGEGG